MRVDDQALSWPADGAGAIDCPRCGAIFPVIDGVPVVLADVAAWLQRPENTALLRQDSDPNTRALLAGMLGADHPLNVARRYLATYLWSHYGDRFPPQLAAPLVADAAYGPGALQRRLLQAIEQAQPPAGPSLDLGCSVGGLPLALAAATGRAAVGLDSDLVGPRAAAEIVRRGQIGAEVRHCGHQYSAFDLMLPELAGRQASFLVADALAPPFRAGSFAVVSAIGMLDSVRIPIQLLAQADALLAPGGLLVLATPYSWSGTATEEGEWLGGQAPHRTLPGPPERFVRQLLEHDETARQMGLDGAYLLLWSELRLPWALRRHDRELQLLLCDALVARKGTAGSAPLTDH